MGFLDLAGKRRSIRNFEKRIPEISLIKKCIITANHAPSSHNSQPWKFIVVKDKQTIEKLSKTQIYSNFLKNAPMVIVALSDEKKSPNHFVEDCSCAIMLLMLQAAELGLGTCWNAVYQPGNQRREDYVRGILKIPKNYRVIANIAIGYPAEKPGKKEIKGFEEAAEVR
jgi:nitroreductase